MSLDLPAIGITEADLLPISPLPPVPLRNMPRAVFDPASDTFLAAVPPFGVRMEGVRKLSIAALEAAPAAIAAANYRGDYNPLATYQIGQSVSHGGLRWYAKTVNLGRAPAANAYWGVIRDIPDPAGHEGKALRVVGGVQAWSALEPGSVNIGDAIYKSDATVTAVDANGAKWLRTGVWAPIDPQITAGLAAKTGYATSMWRPTSTPIAAHMSLTVAANEFWAGGTSGSLAYSADGITWISANIAGAGQIVGVATNGSGLYVAAHSASVHRSTNKGTAWSAATATGLTGAIASIAYGAGVFVVVANHSTGNSIASSPDGVTWTLRANPAAQAMNSVIFAGGQFVAVGNAGAVVTSPDGITWTSRAYGAADLLSTVAYVSGKYVAGGSNPRYSADAVTWAATAGMGSAGFFASNGTVLVRADTSNLVASTNGMTAAVVAGGPTDPLRPASNARMAATTGFFLSLAPSGGGSVGVILRPDFANQTQSFASPSAAGALNLYARYA